MKIKVMLLAMVLSVSSSQADINSSRTTAKSIQSYLAAASVLSTSLIGFKDILDGKIPEKTLEEKLLYSLPSLSRDVMASALEEKSSYLTHLDTLVKTIIEGILNTQGAEATDPSDDKKSQSWKSSYVHQVALSLALFVTMEIINDFVGKTIKNLTGQQHLIRRIIRTAYKIALKTLLDGGIKAKIQGKDASFFNVALETSISTIFVEILGACLKHDLALPDEDVKLLEEAAYKVEDAHQAQETQPLEPTLI